MASTRAAAPAATAWASLPSTSTDRRASAVLVRGKLRALRGALDGAQVSRMNVQGLCLSILAHQRRYNEHAALVDFAIFCESLAKGDAVAARFWWGAFVGASECAEFAHASLIERATRWGP